MLFWMIHWFQNMYWFKDFCCLFPIKNVSLKWGSPPFPGKNISIIYRYVWKYTYMYKSIFVIEDMLVSKNCMGKHDKLNRFCLNVSLNNISFVEKLHFWSAAAKIWSMPMQSLSRVPTLLWNWASVSWVFIWSTALFSRLLCQTKGTETALVHSNTNPSRNYKEWFNISSLFVWLFHLSDALFPCMIEILVNPRLTLSALIFQ